MEAGVFQYIPTGGTSEEDLRSLLALQRAIAARQEFTYLELGSYLGRSLQSFVVDSRCRRIIAIDRRDAASSDERAERPEYPDNTTANMLEGLARVPGGDLGKLVTFDVSADQLNPADLEADLCFIDAEHTNEAALQDAHFCQRVIRERGVIVFHDRTLVARGILGFLGELRDYRAYPLANDLFVVELGIPTLLDDEMVSARVPRRAWLAVARLRAMRPALWLTALRSRG